MQLKPGTELQNGKYRVVKTLGQGGFGITYLAEQVALHRKVAIKEFFMKNYCGRNETTNQVKIGTTKGGREIVSRFRAKFIREALMIAGFDHPGVVKIYDVFEENGTAYFAMEYIGGGSLKERIAAEGALPEGLALQYIREVGEALCYVHSKNVLHFDVKPSNIMVRDSGAAVLIDFGVSKHYDEGGRVTSSTPVGISSGYAPIEQYRQEDISSFTPATDIYALGATLFTLLTGEVPPDAMKVEQEGIPRLPESVSQSVCEAIREAMQPRRRNRPQQVSDFLSLLGSDGTDQEISLDEITDVVVEEPPIRRETPPDRMNFAPVNPVPRNAGNAIKEEKLPILVKVYLWVGAVLAFGMAVMLIRDAIWEEYFLPVAVALSMVVGVVGFVLLLRKRRAGFGVFVAGEILSALCFAVNGLSVDDWVFLLSLLAILAAVTYGILQIRNKSRISAWRVMRPVSPK